MCEPAGGGREAPITPTDGITAGGADAPIERDLFCHGCGYNVRGLRPAALCPECATPVWTALDDALSHVDPAWLARLASGSRWAASALYLVAVAAAIPLLWPDGWGRPLGLAGVFLCYLIGCWRMTTPDPRLAGREALTSPRRLARAALLVGVADVGLFLALRGVVASPVLVNVQLLTSPAGIVGAVAAWGLTTHFEELARRAGDPLARRRAALYRKGFLASWSVALVAAIVEIAGMAPRGWVCLLVPASVIAAGFGFLIVAFPHYLLGRLEACSAAAARLSRSHSPGSGPSTGPPSAES